MSSKLRSKLLAATSQPVNLSVIRSTLPKLTTFVLFMLFIYAFSFLQTKSTTPKSIAVTINGLTESYTTTNKTVGGFLAEIGIPPNQILSVVPPATQKLNPETIVAVETKPKLRNTIVAANFQSKVDAEKAAERALAAAKALAESARLSDLSVAELPLLPIQPKSPTYVGQASWYKFGNGMNAASTQFPRGTKLRVTNVENGKTIDIVINDYGPEDWTGVMIDLNKPAFAKLAPLGLGKINVKYFKI